MSGIIVFSGTSEGRQLSEALERGKIAHLVCVATRTGAEVMEHGTYAKVHEGRLDAEHMRELVQEQKAEILVDATHPYADVVSRTIRACADALGVTYMRVLRESADEGTSDQQGSWQNGQNIRFFPDASACREALSHTEGNILLTTGSKQLSFFAEEKAIKDRLFARVLPTAESLRLCEEAGIGVKQVIAMFGPFTQEMNAAMLAQFGIRVMVTKESGNAGGFPEKVRAAAQAGCALYVIGRPSQEEGISWQEAARMLGGVIAESTEGQASDQQSAAPAVEIALVGIGMGDADTLTVGGKNAIEQAEILLGASRMLAPFRAQYPQKTFVCEYLADNILDAIRVQAEGLSGRVLHAAVLYSGDTGFYSGAATLQRAAGQWEKSCGFTVRIRQYPGISSFSYLCSLLGESYSDAALESWHGYSGDYRREALLVKSVREHERCYLLLSGVKDVRRLGHVLLENGLEHCRIFLGYQLGSDAQQVFSVTAREAGNLENEGLYIAMIRNPQPAEEPLVKILPDDAFLRDKTPMTKEEIRHLSILKLALTPSSVLYDIGAGTGSVSCEAATWHPGITVYAIEQKETAAALLQRNIEHLQCANVHIVEGKAPEALAALPAPTHAFIGGSSGKLQEILELLRAKTPGIRVVVNAISLETLSEILRCARTLQFTPEMVQIQASRSHEVGAYHLVKAENPIWIASFQL